MNYFVPDFGKDHDIKQSENSATAAEGKLGHTFTPKYDEEKDVWVVPTEDAEFKLAGVAEDVHISNKKSPSDPNCSSSGWCGESLWPKGKADEKHSVLRHDTKRGANQAPTKEESATNMERIIKARPDPHPNTDEPEKDERRYDAESLSQCQGDDDDDSCSKRKKSSLVGDEEWKKCHSSRAQKKSQCKDDEDEETCKKRKKSSLVGDDEWKKCHSNAQKKAGTQSLSECKDDEDEDTCSKRKKSSLIGDEEWKKCHSSKAQ